MEIKLYQVDAFTSELFKGNPAAVCPLPEWLSDETLQNIAAENNLSETAFFVEDGDHYQIRWFTPEGEVDLCGHATLATGFVLFNCLDFEGDKIDFESKSGTLTVSRKDDLLVMDFPAQPPVECDLPVAIRAAFSEEILECLQAEDYLVVFADEDGVQTADPDFQQLKRLPLRGVIITAQSDKYDFVARFFAPKYGIPEDPVTGSAYTQLTPYWAEKTGKQSFKAKQLSARGGELNCELTGNRVLISGKAIKYMEGTVKLGG